MTDFVSNFGAFKARRWSSRFGVPAARQRRGFRSRASTYNETVNAGDLDVRLTWTGLGDPFCFALPPDRSATGKHKSICRLPSGHSDGEGRTLAGKPVPREMAGHTITTAMLAFSETWIRAS